MYYFSLPYFFYIMVAIGAVVGVFLAFRNKSVRAQKTVLLSLMLFNFLQHIFKSFVYPHLWGQGFTGLNTAYNMCAFLILSTPFIYLFGSELWKNFITYVGTAAGIAAICVPYWFTVDTAFGWEAIRFYVCHIVLIITSILPLLWGFYKINWRHSFKIPFLFFLALVIITFNEILCFVTGLFDGGNDLYAYLRSVNPCWAFGPLDQFEWVGEAASIFAPDFMLKASNGRYIPLLWYSIPMFVFMLCGAIGLGSWLDHERFMRDVKNIRKKLESLFLIITRKR